MNGPPGIAEGRPGEETAHEETNSASTTIQRESDGNGPTRVYLVRGLTPSGETRRRIYLSETHADEKSAEWRRRGWSVTVTRGTLGGAA